MKRLVDVSSVQGPVDWATLKKYGIDGAYIKCVQGNEGGRDPWYTKHILGAADAGLAVGAYHFAYPLPGRSPEAQAKAFFDGCSGLGTCQGEMPPALDLEWPPPEQWRKWGCTAQQILDWGLACLIEMDRRWGRKPVVYTYPWFWSSCGVPPIEYADYPLWIADYEHASGRVPKDGEAPRHTAPWPKWTLWQHDGNGGLTVPGGPDADFSVFNGDWAEFTSTVTMVTLGV